jgi:hypothetical protein
MTPSLSPEREYLAAREAYVRALARLRAAKAALPSGVTPSEVSRQHKTEWVEDLLRAYRDGERDGGVLARRFGRSRDWVNGVLKMNLGPELRRGSRVEAP